MAKDKPKTFDASGYPGGNDHMTAQEIADLLNSDPNRSGNYAVVGDHDLAIDPFKAIEKVVRVIYPIPSPVNSVRRYLPDERHSITEKFIIGEGAKSVEGYFMVGFFADGAPGELFLVIAKSSGGMLHGFANAWSLAVSLALQYGMPVEKFVEKHRHVSFEPSGNTTLVDVPEASSIVDMIAQFFEVRFARKELK